MWQVSNLSKLEKREMSPFAGRTRTHRLDLELFFWAALMWSCRCPPSAQHSPFLTASVPQNTFLDTHKPPIPFPDPTEMHTIVLKPCFSTVNCFGEDRCLAHFLSSIHEEEKTNADVNTGGGLAQREQPLLQKSSVCNTHEK
ncbi:hypothetical protein FQN60_010930 [Scomber scombrus]|uniref:Uncharacterized protein n=1 Tax=Scomber scombrus TaxID=13677 RepID=A0AAV1N5V7_SCOSC